MTITENDRRRRRAVDEISEISMSAFSSIARVSTTSGSRYLQQLCKHWAHNLAVEYDTEKGSVVFPKDVRGANFASDGTATFVSRDMELEVTVEGSSEEHLVFLQEVVSRHLDRFAFREAPLEFNWSLFRP